MHIYWGFVSFDMGGIYWPKKIACFDLGLAGLRAISLTVTCLSGEVSKRSSYAPVNSGELTYRGDKRSVRKTVFE